MQWLGNAVVGGGTYGGVPNLEIDQCLINRHFGTQEISADCGFVRRCEVPFHEAILRRTNTRSENVRLVKATQT